MANKTLKTRLSLRHDTKTNWETLNPTLLLFEMGIEAGENGGHKIKFGDGVTAWNDLPYTYDLAAILAKIDEASGGTVYELTKTSLTQSDNEILATIGSPKNGDVAAIATVVENVTYQQSGYIYNNKWIALSGTVEADKVIAPENLVLSGNYTQLGNWTKTQSGTTTKEVKGDSVWDIIKEITSKTVQPTITAQPSVSISLSGAGAKEVGTEFTPNWSVSFNPGSYTAFEGQVATGVTVSSYAVTDTNSGSASTQTGSFTKFTVADNTNYKVSVTVQHTEGAVAKDNLGGTSNPELKIAAGSKSANSSAVTGFRSMFAGAVVSPIELNSTGIRSLSGKKGQFTKTFNLSVPEGCTQVVIALPNGHTLTKVADQNAFGTDIVGSFVLQSPDIQVEGVNGYTAADYNVYVYAPDAALGANTYAITCA